MPTDASPASVSVPLNALADASSAYLRSAMRQPVRWEEWGEAAFARARREDKAVLLDIGAVWCHWCHVMDRESYERESTAELINEHFVAIKVDRDERPDVDTRYQSAVAAISGQGGWPLTAFLTPDGRPFFGGTYFPPEDRHGRPGLQRVLLTMAEAFRDRRHEVEESAGSVLEAIEQNESFSGRSGVLGQALVGTLVSATLHQFDPRSGGFGSQPKFPHSPAVDLLVDAASRVSVGLQPALAGEAGRAARFTLEQMAKGGVYDHLAGGFHRYSVDERWVVPHFEKMSYDNSELLRNYVHGFQTFVEPVFARIAREIVAWMRTTLSDQEQGGFFASQDADVSPEDDGDYFTWTRDEVRAVLPDDEFALAAAYFEVQEVGDMQHNPAKNVLHATGTLEAAAKRAGILPGVAEDTLQRAREGLLAARSDRPTPYVDRTLYTSWNALCISAFLEAGRVLAQPETTAFGLRSLDRVMAGAIEPDGRVMHVVSYGETGTVGATRVRGLLDDYVFLALAALDGWETSGDARYFRAAEAITQEVLRRFHDGEGGGFFDVEAPVAGEHPLGVLGARRKPLQDSPTPAGNPAAAVLLMRMEALTGREAWLVIAQDTLEAFAGVVEHFGLYAATYGLALQRLSQQPILICILGEGAEAQRMEAVAMARYAVNKTVLRLRSSQLQELPPALAETLPHLPQPDAGEAIAIVCSGRTCLPPVRDTEALLLALNGVL